MTDVLFSSQEEGRSFGYLVPSKRPEGRVISGIPQSDKGLQEGFLAGTTMSQPKKA